MVFGDVLVSDTSVLVNFLAVDQMALLSAYKAKQGCQILITEHVKEEITVQYPQQLERLNAALATGVLIVVAVDQLAELEMFAHLSLSGRLGRGECSAIAVAVCRGFALAIDDRRAYREALLIFANLQVLGTQEIVVDMIRADVLTVKDADFLKKEWSDQHRFRLSIESFADIIN